MIGPDSRVSLARQARLKLDPRTGRQMLLYPEKGLDLNDTAARVAALCREERAVRDIVERMVSAAIDSPDGARADRGRGAGLPARAGGPRAS